MMVVKGSHLSEETRARMSEGQRRFYATPEGSRVKEERARVIREVRTGCVVSEETRKRISESGKGNRNHLGHPHSLESRLRMSKVKLGKFVSDETKMKMSETSKKLWQLESHKTKLVKASKSAMSIHPNKPETIVLNMLNEIAPNEWAFVGDGQLIIGGKNPDFANVNGKKLLCECFGRYWHGVKARCYEETEEGRIALFKKYGFRTLVVWEDELKHPEKVMIKLREFAKGGVHD